MRMCRYAGLGLTAAIAQGSSLKPVERGVPVLVDYGGGYNGYVTDETRVYVVGDMKEPFKKAYEVAREIVEDVTSFGREGIDCTEIFNRAVQLVKRAQLEDHFMGFGEGQVSFIGHGLGLEINELPVITSRHSRVLKEGMVFAFEPKFIFPGEGSVGIEVDFIVRKQGLERIVDFPNRRRVCLGRLRQKSICHVVFCACLRCLTSSLQDAALSTPPRSPRQSSKFDLAYGPSDGLRFAGYTWCSPTGDVVLYFPRTRHEER